MVQPARSISRAGAVVQPPRSISRARLRGCACALRLLPPLPGDPITHPHPHTPARHRGSAPPRLHCSSLISAFVLSRGSQADFFVALWTAAQQAPLRKGFSQARILEWVAKSFARRSSRPRNRTPELAGGFFTTSTTWLF